MASKMAGNKRWRVWFRKLQRFILTTILGGVVVVLPLAILYLLVRLLIRTIVPILHPISQVLWSSERLPDWFINLLSFLIVILAFFFLGLAVRTRFGQRFFDNIEAKYLSQVPLYTLVRETVRQFTGQRKTPFSQVVLVDAFGSGVLMTGFVTDELPNDMFTVFAPTAPNPTNGFVFHVRRDQLTFLKVKPEDAMRSIIAVGSGSDVLFTTPPEPPTPADDAA